MRTRRSVIFLWTRSISAGGIQNESSRHAKLSFQHPWDPVCFSGITNTTTQDSLIAISHSLSGVQVVYLFLKSSQGFAAICFVLGVVAWQRIQADLQHEGHTIRGIGRCLCYGYSSHRRNSHEYISHWPKIVTRHQAIRYIHTNFDQQHFIWWLLCFNNHWYTRAKPGCRPRYRKQ